MLKKVATALDGYKLVIGVLVAFGVKVYDGMTGSHYSTFTDSVLAVFGWDDGGFDVAGGASAALVLIGLAGKVYKAQRQVRAGSSLSGALSTEGYLAQHQAELAVGKPEAIAVEIKVEEAVEKKAIEAMAEAK